MLFLKIYIGFSILTFVLLLMQTYVMFKRLKRKHPDIVSKFNKDNKSSVLEKIFIYIKLFVTCFVPITNIGIFYVLIFESEKIEEKAFGEIIKEIKEGF